ncbi:hypothetical protein COW36_14625 [bacterium (Candidatus Blackallbacteria) CG17_big_fil_post_rev_8_21_14_2_50_48_46]|uniref:TM2 domain-containing protein n=1 Tax=bacterium (Candidatus Blackallbacteria) CG17_big_fil_post_rev_8_21_14_2_50_48_46 TaxID=2014261 RepID=A0A2M7G2S6_9BACT|nr:MAG: hypothetical protein COW64_11925 [bacterium (Candidatus Blackallbacteria) CG18_big_fil_WC_8_21_14_2_50_49_26]PIW15949.1 MAG: hypothetical protein COW36_14625 [bacterium (Candidatus Blackallbacteria) CG17_big_fil_post_rev_8_21_14_2_50_48_46]PIW50361.1 MAG: hypothetical protein COW20_02340 [bacterium (Candidatus Blackallbacteria) CG13_big_fil_rev_8_21_14_2_50_49_14]
MLCLNKVDGRIFCDQCAQKAPALRRRSSISVNASINQDLNSLVLYKNRVLAALLAMTLGGFGGHKFYLGQMGWGFLYMIFFWTGIPAFVGFVEGVLYLIQSDEEFALSAASPLMLLRAQFVQNRQALRTPRGKNENNSSKNLLNSDSKQALARLSLRSDADYERYLLHFARENKGILTIGQIAADTPISIDKAEHHLAKLEARGFTRVEIDPNTGVIRYLFPEFLYPSLDSPDHPFRDI